MGLVSVPAAGAKLASLLTWRLAVARVFVVRVSVVLRGFDWFWVMLTYTAFAGFSGVRGFWSLSVLNWVVFWSGILGFLG